MKRFSPLGVLRLRSDPLLPDRVHPVRADVGGVQPRLVASRAVRRQLPVRFLVGSSVAGLALEAAVSPGQAVARFGARAKGVVGRLAHSSTRLKRVVEADLPAVAKRRSGVAEPRRPGPSAVEARALLSIVGPPAGDKQARAPRGAYSDPGLIL
jgi:hypothetical protein